MDGQSLVTGRLIQLPDEHRQEISRTENLASLSSYGGSRVSVMSKAYSSEKFCLFTAVMMVSIWIAFTEMATAEIIVIKNEIDIKKYEGAFVDVQNDGYDRLADRRSGEEVTYLRYEISRFLMHHGINPHKSEADAQLNVECHFSIRSGLPRLIRHFKLKVRYISEVRIQLIDRRTADVLYDVEYKRPWSAKNPDRLIDMMLEKALD
jgi:hypothetical protein